MSLRLSITRLCSRSDAMLYFGCPSLKHPVKVLPLDGAKPLSEGASSLCHPSRREHPELLLAFESHAHIGNRETKSGPGVKLRARIVCLVPL